MASRGNRDGRRYKRGGQRGSGTAGHSQNKDTKEVDESSPVIQTFRGFQKELDSKHDKYERIVKISRDITIESKRTIFLLHRMTGSERAETITDAEEKLASMRKGAWTKVAEELHGEDPYKYLRAYSPGLQEYIEAVSFLHYLQHGGLVTLEKVQGDLIFEHIKESNTEKDQEVALTESEELAPPAAKKIPREDQISDATSNATTVPTTLTIHVPPIEYMLGIADLTGELMRMVIYTIGTGDMEQAFRHCNFMRTVYDAFTSFGNVAKELNRKLSVLRQSLQKVETACYTLQVRGSEIPKHMLVDVISTGDQQNKLYAEDDGNGDYD